MFQMKNLQPLSRVFWRTSEVFVFSDWTQFGTNVREKTLVISDPLNLILGESKWLFRRSVTGTATAQSTTYTKNNDTPANLGDKIQTVHEYTNIQ